jgi:hypothetical protein
MTVVRHDDDHDHPARQDAPGPCPLPSVSPTCRSWSWRHCCRGPGTRASGGAGRRRGAPHFARPTSPSRPAAGCWCDESPTRWRTPDSPDCRASGQAPREGRRCRCPLWTHTVRSQCHIHAYALPPKDSVSHNSLFPHRGSREQPGATYKLGVIQASSTSDPYRRPRGRRQ